MLKHRLLHFNLYLLNYFDRISANLPLPKAQSLTPNPLFQHLPRNYDLLYF